MSSEEEPPTFGCAAAKAWKSKVRTCSREAAAHAARARSATRWTTPLPNRPSRLTFLSCGGPPCDSGLILGLCEDAILGLRKDDDSPRLRSL